VHTVLAAGGVAAPIPADLPAEGAAELLSSCDARMLIATHDLADAAVAAADFSRVRQVITFGQAPAASDFRDLLTLEPTALPALDPVRQDALVLAGGERVTHTGLLARMAVLDERVRLTESDVVLATWAPDGGCDLVALIALAIARGALLVAANGLPAADLPGTRHDFGVTVLTAEPGTLERITPTHTPSPA
ncbi:MAG: hypothetical protein HOY71_44280, partial [Nonomuraea sp.]|nr:hypothetical protein [Nonomuraea sp.]